MCVGGGGGGGGGAGDVCLFVCLIVGLVATYISKYIPSLPFPSPHLKKPTPLPPLPCLDSRIFFFFFFCFSSPSKVHTYLYCINEKLQVSL